MKCHKFKHRFVLKCQSFCGIFLLKCHQIYPHLLTLLKFLLQDEFEYLISAGIALHVQAISNPAFPLIESTGKNLLKLYINDVGILTGILYGNNIRSVLGDEKAYVLSNERQVTTNGNITYLPIYYVMFFQNNAGSGVIL